MTELQVQQGDITELNVDAIVNAANESLLGGGGVDGAIHKAAGPGLLYECRALNGCNVGQAKITQGYKLAATYVVHTVGPRWQGGLQDEPALLASCYQQSLKLAASYKMKSIAFPAISTGIFGYPIEEACCIAINTVSEFLQNNQTDLQNVVFCCFSERDKVLYEAMLCKIEQSPPSIKSA